MAAIYRRGALDGPLPPLTRDAVSPGSYGRASHSSSINNSQQHSSMYGRQSTYGREHSPGGGGAGASSMSHGGAVTYSRHAPSGTKHEARTTQTSAPPVQTSIYSNLFFLPTNLTPPPFLSHQIFTYPPPTPSPSFPPLPPFPAGVGAAQQRAGMGERAGGYDPVRRGPAGPGRDRVPSHQGYGGGGGGERERGEREGERGEREERAERGGGLPGTDSYRPSARRELTTPPSNLPPPPPPHPSGLAKRRPARRTGSGRAYPSAAAAERAVAEVHREGGGATTHHHDPHHHAHHHSHHQQHHHAAAANRGGSGGSSTTADSGTSGRSSYTMNSSEDRASRGSSSELRRRADVNGGGGDGTGYDVLGSPHANAGGTHGHGHNTHAPHHGRSPVGSGGLSRALAASAVQAPATPPRLYSPTTGAGAVRPSRAAIAAGMVPSHSPAGARNNGARGAAVATRVKMFDEPRGLKVGLCTSRI
jgi:hypothetical protein